MELGFEVKAKIRKTVVDVFDAVYNPKKLSAYFTTGGASAPLDGGATVTWDFHDFPGGFPVKVIEAVKNHSIVLEWDNVDGGPNRVRFSFEGIESDATQVRVKEVGWAETSQKALDDSYSRCEGWTQMLCCLKAWIEHGVKLREFFY